MYIQLTTRCNMDCAHCCMSATRKGLDMSREVFIEALNLAANWGEYVTLGGGEPTLHKEFFDFLDKTIEYHLDGRLEQGPLVITNGKLKGKAHKLLDYVENESPLYVELSQDEWHEPIDPSVVQRFRAHDRRKNRIGWASSSIETGSAGIRTVKSIIPVGRAAEPARGILTDPSLQCCCETALVDPEGTVWSCGCKHTKIGNVWDSDVLDGYHPDFAHQGGFEPEEETEPDTGL